MSPAPEPTLPDWDRPGALSIVVQGPLTEASAVEMARNCQHWRTLFPAAELILAISSTDLLDAAAMGGVLERADVAAIGAKGGLPRSAARAIVESCDQICLAPPAVPLPPIKLDTKGPNNVNLQIAAAQAGLALATGGFILRVRSDLVFLDRSFIDQYAQADQLPRATAAVLTRRVLIAWLYTLNPFTIERLPLHFSDWFHFGAAADVRRLWDVPPMTLQDAAHYAAHPHPPGSNAAERLFLTRLAVEQYLMLHAFRSAVPGLTLGFHNDRSAVDLSLDVLLDNFALCDLGAARCFFPKYAHEFDNPLKRTHCLTREDWFAMATHRDVDHRVTLAAKIDAAQRGEGVSVREPLPRTITAASLRADAAERLNGELVATAREGTLFATDRIALPAGRYQARLLATTLEGDGSIALQVGKVGGEAAIAERIIVVADGLANATVVAFDLPHDRTDIVLRCRFEGLWSFAVSSLALERRDGPPVPRFQQLLPRAIAPTSLSVRIGALRGGEIVGGGQDGTLFFGPYAWIVPGRYTARVGATVSGTAGEITLEVTQEFGDRVLARQAVIVAEDRPTELAIDFDVPGESATRFEIVCHLANVERIVVTGIVLSDRATPLPQRPPVSLRRRRFRALSLPFRAARRDPA